MEYEGQLYYVVNKKLDVESVMDIIDKCRVRICEHEGKECYAAIVGDYKEGFTEDERNDKIKRWEIREKTDNLVVTDGFLEEQNCMLLSKGLSGRALYVIRTCYQIIRIFYNNEHRLGIAAGYYKMPEDDTKARVLEQKWEY